MHYIHIITSGGGKFTCGSLTYSLNHCSSEGFSAQPLTTKWISDSALIICWS